jgi:hypothetical protein
VSGPLGVNIIRYGLTMNDAGSGGPFLSEIPELKNLKNEEKNEEIETLYGASVTLFFSDDHEGITYCMSGVFCLRLSCCINALNCCIHYLCLRGWVYVFYVGHIDKIMKSFPCCNLKLTSSSSSISIIHHHHHDTYIYIYIYIHIYI